VGSRAGQHHRRQILALAAAALPALPLGGLEPLAAQAQTAVPYSQSGSGGTRSVVTVGGPLQLKVRRLPDAVEVVIEGVGETPQLQQSTRGPGWEGLLFTGQPTSLRTGPQRVALPEAGFASISLDGAGSGYRIQVNPTPGAGVPRPVVSADGRDLILSFAVPTNPQLRSATPSMTTPGRVSDPSFVPPLQPRATAPPVGDIAVGTMVIRNRSFVNVSGPPITMTVRNANARDVLQSVAQMGGYGFAYVEETVKSLADVSTSGTGYGQRGQTQGQEGPTGNFTSTNSNTAAANSTFVRTRKVEQQILEPPPVTVSFKNEPFGRAFNTILLVAGLQGKIEAGSRMIFVGPAVLDKTLGPTYSKVYRLNQASSDAAADYLASLGAEITKISTITNIVTSGQAQSTQVAGGPQTNNTQTQSITKTETYGASTGPLRGLRGSTDSRLQSITLVGDSQVIAVAEGYLRQLDLRQRQVALSVKILDVTLDNDTTIENSFAFRYGNNFIVNDRGQLVGAFGGLLPPLGDQFSALSGSASSAKPEVVDVTLDPITGQQVLPFVQPPVSPAPVNPGSVYQRNNFYDLVRATIESRSTKVLASPTLILTDNPEIMRAGFDTGIIGLGLRGGTSPANTDANIGRTRANEAFVTIGENVITNYTVQAGQNGAPNTCQPDFSVAGLTFGAKVRKIDDNGFVTFSISPTITATTRTQDVPNCGPIDILAIRSLESGSARVRDGQTLIMTGVISDLDSQVVKKWPILGDLPLVGQFFRDTQGTRRKRELVILVTPRILRDDQGGAFGYGYQPSIPQTRDFLRQAGS
jgi:type IV pilus assembly protein PilQ